MKKIEDVLPEKNVDSIPVIPQLLGHEAEEFVELGNRLYELGYNTLNWNMGCPMRRVAAKHRGSGILPYPDEIRAILDTVFPRMKASLSVKVRLGYYSDKEIDAVIPVLNDYPLESITVHPRIGKQVYSGRPDLKRLAEILPAIKHQVIYNGDICSIDDYAKIRQKFPDIKDVMIGRGALYNPLLPLQIKDAFPSDFTSCVPLPLSDAPTAGCFILSLIDDILALSISDEAKVRKIKEYWCLLSKAVPGTEERKRRVLHASERDEMLRLIFEMTK